MHRRPSYFALIEPLESRIAPATLVSPTTVTFQDKNGDIATVKISAPLLTRSNVKDVFLFDTGSVNGVNSTMQQLESLDIAALGPGANGINISITAQPEGMFPGVVNVGFINASGIALGNVTVGGDVGRIDAGNSTLGIHSLSVGSIGAQGLATQRSAGANLDSHIAGRVGSIIVNGVFDAASIGINGGGAVALGNLTVVGNIDGGTIQTQGGINNILVGGSIVGESGTDAGAIGVAGGIGAVLIEGSVTGGDGNYSGAVFATGNIGSVEIGGSINGGNGARSGEVASESSIGIINVVGSVIGGDGAHSGVILASGNIGSVTIGDGLFGSLTSSAGHIGAGGNIGSISLGLEGIGGANFNCNISSGGNIGSFASNGPVSNTLVEVRGGIGSISLNEGGAAHDVFAGDSIEFSGFDAGGNIGPINSYGNIAYTVFLSGNYLGSKFSDDWGAALYNEIASTFRITTFLKPAHIGNITVTGTAGGPGGAEGISYSTFLAGADAIRPSKTPGTINVLVPTGSSVGNISVTGNLEFDQFESGGIGATTTSGTIDGTNYVATDGSALAEGIGPITVNVANAPAAWPYGAVYESNFTSNANIGDISVTMGGVTGEGSDDCIDLSNFQAGRSIGNITVTDNVIVNSNLLSTEGISGSFIAGLKGNGGIGNITVNVNDTGGNGEHIGIGGRFEAGAAPGASGNIGNITVSVASPSGYVAGIQGSVFRAHGNIGAITSDLENVSPESEAISFSMFSAYGSIGNITAEGSIVNGSQFLAGYDIGPDLLFGNENLGSHSSALQAGQSVGNVTVTGYFEGSDIVASVIPDSNYYFGSFRTNTNVGSGGSIGIVDIGTEIPMGSNPLITNTDEQTLYAIEAAHFASSGNSAPTVTAFGYTSTLPVLLYTNTGGLGDVYIAVIPD